MEMGDPSIIMTNEIRNQVEVCVESGDVENPKSQQITSSYMSSKRLFHFLGGSKIAPVQLAKLSPRNNISFIPESSSKSSKIQKPESLAEYILYERSQVKFYHYFALAPLIGIAIITQVFIGNNTNNRPYFGISLAFTIFAIAIYLILLLVNIFNLERYGDSIFGKLVKRFHLSWFGRNIENILCVSSTFMFGFVLYGRVDNGQCDRSLNAWNYQSCNPVADVHSVPHAQILLLYISPIVNQICFRGISATVIFFSWGAGMAFVLASIIYVASWQDIPSLIFSLFFLHIAFAIKMFSHKIFLESRKAAFAETRKQASDSKFELSVRQRDEARDSSIKKQSENIQIFNKAKEDKWFMDKEREALTSLIGNVAHDLKTPLQSFRMDLEVLITRILKDYGKFNIQPNTDNDDDDHPITTLSSLNAACDFMSMAINRSIDFAKASGNIALVPAMETFNIATALSVPVNVIKHLQSAMNIVVNELPPKLCLNLISDKHWFSENVLCLLSNAVKYSDGGTVKLTIELIDEYEKETDAMATSRLDKSGRSCTENETDGTPVSRASIRVSIEDTGIGLSKETRDTLFQPFKQAQRMAGGTGLGLFSLSKRMEALGGSRGVEERKDGKRGSIFWFAFPYRPDLSGCPKTEDILEIEEDTECESPLGPLVLSPIRTSISRHHFLTSARIPSCEEYSEIQNLHVMLIDDSLTIIKVAGRSLRQNGYHVTTANNGSAGLDRLIEGYDSDEFHFVLMDLQMPVMDGIEAVRRYRTFEAGKNLEKQLADPLDVPRRRLPIIGNVRYNHRFIR